MSSENPKTIPEARELKKRMDHKISDAIHEFEEATALEVTRVDFADVIRAYSAVTGRSTWKRIETEVKL